jgi:spoIIIJ-associated protein
MADTAAEETMRELLEELVEAMGLEAEIEVAADDESVTGTLHGDDLGLFIGRHGQTIDAVQHIATRILLADPEAPKLRVVVDAAGYRERRKEALERQADQAAEEAVRYNRAISLDAMTASERKLVHEYLRERGGVETYSEGEEPERHLVVAPLVS